MEELKGRIEEIIFYNRDNGYTVAVFETDDEMLTVVGNLPMSGKGKAYLLKGSFKTHPTYGEQFAFSEFEELKPEGSAEIESFLASGVLRGVGKKTAKAIVKKFGEATFDVLDNEPHRLTEVDGIGAKKAETIIEAYREHNEFARIMIYFRQFGISPENTMRLYREYGEMTIEAVKENPYRLVEEVYGIGFRKADAIAIKLGVDKEDEFRLKSGVKFVLRHYAGEGNTFCPKKELCESAGQMLDVSTELVSDTVTEMAFEGSIYLDNIDGRNLVYLATYYLAEKNLCKNIKELNEAELKPINGDVESMIESSANEKGITLSENQKTAVRESLKSGISIITGGPGTGKTTIINSILAVLRESGIETAIAAPTGRAAKRITETSGVEASTIHRLLEYYYSESDESMSFGRNSENRLEKDAVVVDEASMIDLLLMDGLISAIKPGTRLIIVGDADQLPSVGAGNVLKDLIDSEYVNAFKLTDIFRQARESLIVVNAHKINRGEYPDYNEKGKEFFLMRQGGEEEILATIKDLCARRLPAYYTHCNAISDIQVLTPVRKGTLGIHHINKELQNVLNPPAEDKSEKTFGGKIFRCGDKVMQIRNNYELKWKRLSDSVTGEGIFNGDAGYISEIDNEYGQVTVVYEEDKYVTYDNSQLDELELAYAVTVHKSQGSEYPIIVMPISWFPPMLATRNLLYTAVTRGKEVVVLVGSERKLEAMVDNNRIVNRNSGLKDRLKNLLEESKIMHG